MNSRRFVWLAASVLGLLFLASRYRSMATDFELNLDESHLAAQALRYRVDPIPWRSVDGATSGPLSAWLLLLLHALGVPLSFPALHRIAAMVLLTSVGLLAWSAWKRLGVLAALGAALTSVVWLSSDIDPDFVHYSSELMPCLLISGAFAAGFAGRRPVLCAFLLGLVPWSKLQASPIALAMGLWLIAEACRGQAHPLRRGLLLVAAALAPSVAFLLLIAGGGALREFWLSYVVINAYYAGPVGAGEWAGRLVRLLTLKPISPWLCPALASGFAVALWSAIRRTQTSLGAMLGPLGIVTGVAVMCAVRPQMDADHYELLLLPPLFLLTASIVHAAGTLSRREIVPWGVVVGLAFLAATYAPDALRTLRNGYHTDDDGLVDRVLAEARRRAPAAKTFGYWGWGPSVYVRTGSVPPTRHSLAYLMTADSPGKAFMRQTYMEDTTRNPTDIFFDLFPTGTGMTPLGDFPELEAYVRQHFDRVATISTLKGPAVVYVRKTATP